MRNIFITTIIIICCSAGLNITMHFESLDEITLEKAENNTKEVRENSLFHYLESLESYSVQSSEVINNPKFGPAGHVGGGVNIHFVKGHTQDLDMIAAAGFKFVRMDFVWQNIEEIKGNYNWAAYDELTANLEQRGLRAIYILDYSNSLYEGTVEFNHQDTGKSGKGISAPVHDESIAAFARWSAASALHFHGNNIIWEIWNEPNVSHFWKPKPNVTQYTKLSIAAASAIKDQVPEATIIGPATSKVPLPFLESYLSSGILKYIDAVSVHPYRDYSKSPETATTDYEKLHELISQYAPDNKKNIPIISSEWGYASATNGVSLEKQAEFIVRMQLINLLNSIPVSIWYDWKNDGKDPGNFEHNCGTVTFDLQPKPSYKCIQIMNRQLENFTMSHRMDLGNDHDYVIFFQNNKGNFKIAAWTMDIPHTIKINIDVSGINGATAIDGYGNLIKLKTEQKKLFLNLDTLPLYIDLSGDVR